MYCHYCGNKVPAGAAFCGFCGKPQKAKGDSAGKSQPMILFYIIGALFLLGGLLPYLIPGDSWTYGEYILSVYKEYNYSQKAMAAISVFSSFVSSFASLFFFSSSALAFYVGLLLAKKKRRFTTPVILCAVVHILSSLSTCFAYLLIHQFPQFVLSLYVSDREVISLGASIIRARPNLLYPYQQLAFLRLAISVVLVTLSVALVVCKKKWADQLPMESRKASTLGSPLMLLGVSALPILRVPLTAVQSQYYGSMSLAANQMAHSLFGQNFSLLFLLAFFAVIAVAMIFNRAKGWVLTASVVGTTLLFGVIALLLSPKLMEQTTGPAEMLALTLASLQSLILSSMVILIAVFFWFHAVARNQIPTWLQILLPIGFPIVYATAEIVTNVVLRANLGISFGIVLPSLVAILLSLLVHTKQPKTEHLI